MSLRFTSTIYTNEHAPPPLIPFHGKLLKMYEYFHIFSKHTVHSYIYGRRIVHIFKQKSTKAPEVTFRH